MTYSVFRTVLVISRTITKDTNGTCWTLRPKGKPIRDARQRYKLLCVFFVGYWPARLSGADPLHQDRVPRWGHALLPSRFEASIRGPGLDLLGAPAGVGLAHVQRGLDGRDVLEGDVADADEANGTAGNLAEGHLANDEAADKDVDCVCQPQSPNSTLEQQALGQQTGEINLQIPRPMKEKRKGA